ncbi:hypothetical protein [Candidatus Pristimantibacillus sp. PTI5]
MVINNMNKNVNRQNQAGLRGQSGKLKTDKFAKRPSSLNGINKQLP